MNETKSLYDLVQERIKIIDNFDYAWEKSLAIDYLKAETEMSILLQILSEDDKPTIYSDLFKRLSLVNHSKPIQEILYENHLKDPKFNTNKYKNVVKLFYDLDNDELLNFLYGRNRVNNDVFDSLSKYFTDDDDKDGDHDEQQSKRQC